MSAALYQINDEGSSYPNIFWGEARYISKHAEIPPDMRKRMAAKADATDEAVPTDNWKNIRYIKRAEITNTYNQKLLYLLQNPLYPSEWFFMDAKLCKGYSKQYVVEEMLKGTIVFK